MATTKRVRLESLEPGDRYMLDPEGDVWISDGWAGGHWSYVRRESDNKPHHELESLMVIPLPPTKTEENQP